jgi:hypothetical protein
MYFLLQFDNFSFSHKCNLNYSFRMLFFDIESSVFQTAKQSFLFAFAFIFLFTLGVEFQGFCWVGVEQAQTSRSWVLGIEFNI